MIHANLLHAKSKGLKKLAVLIDPDKIRLGLVDKVIEYAVQYEVDYFLIGGSIVLNDMLDEVLTSLKEKTRQPLILFPGNTFQLNEKADGILLLSLISGRNPELLIGQHVVAAPYLKKSRLEVISTGYMLIDGGMPTSVAYMSNTSPIPRDKADIALCTAMAGELLGMKAIFLDAGSGARFPVPTEMISMIKENIDLPILVGGGIRNPEMAFEMASAGADVIVVGSAVERDPAIIADFAAAVHSKNIKV